MAAAAPTFASSLVSYLEAETRREGSGKTDSFKAFLSTAQKHLAKTAERTNRLIEAPEILKDKPEELNSLKMRVWLQRLREPNYSKFFNNILYKADEHASDPLGIFTFYKDAQAMANLRKIDNGNLLLALEYLTSEASKITKEGKTFPYKDFAAEERAILELSWPSASASL